VALGIPAYFDIVKNPMDLSTVKSNIISGFYNTSKAFADDMRLMFQNALLFNPPATFVHDVADKYLKQFEATYEKQVASYVRSQIRRSSLASANKVHNKAAQNPEEEDEADVVPSKPTAKRPHRMTPLEEEKVKSVPHSTGANRVASTKQNRDGQHEKGTSANPAGSSEKSERRKLLQALVQIPASHVDELLAEVANSTGKRYQSMTQLIGAAHTMSLPEMRCVNDLSKAVLEGKSLPHRMQTQSFASLGSSVGVLQPATSPMGDSVDEKGIVLPQPTAVSPSVEMFARNNGTVPHSVSPFMQRQTSPVVRGPSALNADGNESNIPKILSEKRPDSNGNERSDVARPTWSLVALTPRPEQSEDSSPRATSAPSASSNSEQAVSPAPSVPQGQDGGAWSQFRTQNQLREQREQIRAKDLEEKRARLEAAERQRNEHMLQLKMEALRIQEEEARKAQAMREEEQRRLESEREAIHRRMAGQERTEEEEERVTDMFDELQRSSGMNGSLLQLDGSLLMDDFHSDAPGL